MSARERLYEIRKRYRKTEIWSESWRVDWKLSEFYQFCLHLEDGERIAENVFGGCPYAHDYDAYRRRIEARARFHRPTRKERIYERRKRQERGAALKICRFLRRTRPETFRDFRRFLLLHSFLSHPSRWKAYKG